MVNIILFQKATLSINFCAKMLYHSCKSTILLASAQDSLYASKSTIDFGESLEDRWRSFLNQLEYIDPRGYVNIGTRQRECAPK
jgi:hypothetical protein